MAIYAPSSISDDIELLSPNTEEGAKSIANNARKEGMELFAAAFMLPMEVANHPELSLVVPPNVIEAALNDPYQILVILQFVEGPGNTTAYIGRLAFDAGNRKLWEVPKSNAIFTANGGNPGGAEAMLEEVADAMNESLPELIALAEEEFQGAVLTLFGAWDINLPNFDQAELDLWISISKLALYILAPQFMVAVDKLECLGEVIDMILELKKTAEDLPGGLVDPVTGQINDAMWKDESDEFMAAIEEVFDVLKECLWKNVAAARKLLNHIEKLFARNQGKLAGSQTYFALVTAEAEQVITSEDEIMLAMKLKIIQGLKNIANFYLSNVAPKMADGLTPEEAAQLLKELFRSISPEAAA